MNIWEEIFDCQKKGFELTKLFDEEDVWSENRAGLVINLLLGPAQKTDPYFYPAYDEP